MRRLVGTIGVALAGLFTHAAGTWGQGHDHGGGQAQGHQAAQACLIEFEKVVGEGRGREGCENQYRDRRKAHGREHPQV